jgi:hypothetical protein
MSGPTGNVLRTTNLFVTRSVKMPFIIAGVVKSMALSFLGNSGVIENVVILLLETLAKKTDSDVDDKLVALLKESLGKSD